jgi:FkbM family methyltransferase
VMQNQGLNFVKKLIPQTVRDYITLRLRYRESGGTITHKYMGEELELWVADGVTKEWYGRDWPPDQRQEILFLQTLGFNRDSIIFDIGAHQGVVAMLLKRKLAPEGKVIAVEMDKINWIACLQNLKLNDVRDILIVHAAVGDRIGIPRGTGLSNSSFVTRSGLLGFMHQRTDMITIDKMCSNYGMPDLIYLDVEGAEVLALKQASVALQSMCTWFVEMHGNETCRKFGGTNETIVQTFRNNGYELYFSFREDQPFRPLSVEAVVPKDRCHIIATKRLVASQNLGLFR